MKILVNNTLYLQKYEIAYITHELKSTPCSVIEEIFDSHEAFIVNGVIDGFNFKYAFKRPESIEWLLSRTDIVDYDEFSQIPLSKLKKLHRKMTREHRNNIRIFNSQDDYTRRCLYDTKSHEFNKTGHEITSLGYLIKARKGKIKFVLPSEYTSHNDSHKLTSSPAHYRK